MGALSPAVPSWGHKSRRDGYAYAPWGKLDILPYICILCRQSRHVTANQSFQTRKLPDTQPERQQPWKRQRETLVLREKGRSLPARSAVVTGRGGAKMIVLATTSALRALHPTLASITSQTAGDKSHRFHGWLAGHQLGQCSGTQLMELGIPKPKRGQPTSQHSGGTHLLNPEPSANLTGPFSATRTSTSR